VSPTATGNERTADIQKIRHGGFWSGGGWSPDGQTRRLVSCCRRDGGSESLREAVDSISHGVRMVDFFIL